LRIAELLDLILTCTAVVLWYARPELGPWPLALVAAGRVARVLTRRESAWRHTRFDLPLLLFLVSAAVGAWVAFDQAAASAKFWQIVGGLALYDSLVFAPEQAAVLRWHFSPVRGMLLLLPALIAAYALLTTDWSLAMGKVPWLDSVMRWFASWQPQATVHEVHPNVSGSMIATLIPLQIASASGLAFAWPLVGLSFLGLLMTASRGAWIALAAAGGGWLVWRLWGRSWGRRTWLILAGLLALALAAGAALVLTWGPLLLPGGRPDLWRNSIDLALDTPFTGIGLGKSIFQMPFSSYVLLVHVGHTSHSHTLPLDIWLEQGLLGLTASLWILVSALRARSVSPKWRLAGLASLAVILVHGLVDDPLYASRGVALLFIPLAVIAREDLQAGSPPIPARLTGAAAPARRTGPAVLALAAMAVLVLALLPQVRAAFQANLGALSQTRAELSVYRWPEWPIQDALRRAPEVNLEPAIARYRAALALDPTNAAANRRLGQIELSRGEDAAARRHLEAAYAAAPEQRATRQLLGEVYAIGGQAAEASALWGTLDLTTGQLPIRVWWYNSIGEAEKAQHIQAVAGDLKQ
jgi:O-antigen ligase